MNFDLIISNPPYNNGADLKILKQVYHLSDRIIFIHPTSWLHDNKHKYKLFNTTRKMVEPHLEYHQELEGGNLSFGITLFSKISINLFNKNCQNPIDVWEIDAHGSSAVYQSLKKKILDYCRNKNSCQKVVKYKNPNQNFEVGISGIRGHQFERYPGDKTHDFFTFIQLTDESMHIGKDTRYFLKFLFDTENEQINFKEYLKLKLTRFCLSIYKINQHLDSGELASVPYMPTYEKQWTDEEVATELGLTDEELRWAINWVPNYYPEDKEKYK